MIDVINKIFSILKKKIIINVYHIISFYVFIIHRVKPASPEKKRFKIMRKIATIKQFIKNKF